MPTYLLRKASDEPLDRNVFDVIQTLEDDGYDLRVGAVRETVGAGMARFWAWSCHGANGREATREEAMAAFKVAAVQVTGQDLRAMRRQEEATANKYALWKSGYKDLSREIMCPCGASFDPGVHDETMAHIGHIKAERRG
jgi:hypothetical protein